MGRVGETGMDGKVEEVGGEEGKRRRGAGVALGTFCTLSLNPFAACRTEHFPCTESGHLI